MLRVIENVHEHIKVSKEKIEAVNRIIDGIDKTEPVVVWGAGNHTFRILAHTALKDLNIIAFIDNDPIKQGLTLNGVKICSKSFLNNYNGKIILCTAFSNEVIEKQLFEIGLQNEIIRLDK